MCIPNKSIWRLCIGGEEVSRGPAELRGCIGTRCTLLAMSLEDNNYMFCFNICNSVFSFSEDRPCTSWHGSSAPHRSRRH